MTSVTDEKCRTCGHDREWHDKHRPLHPFNDGQAGAAAFLGPKRDQGAKDDPKGAQRGSQAAPWPFDPVLRQALINRGVITPEDLREAEDQIRAVTAQFEQTVKESRDGEGEVRFRAPA